MDEVTFSENLDGRQCRGYRDWSVIGQPNLQARIHPSMPDFYVIMLSFSSQHNMVQPFTRADGIVGIDCIE